MFPASSKGGGQSLGFPDVCKTPILGVPVPIPYANLGMMGQKAKTATKKVQFESKKTQKKVVDTQQELINLLKKATAAFAKIEGRHAETISFDAAALKEYSNAMYAAIEVTQKLQQLLFQAASVTVGLCETKRQVAVALDQQVKMEGKQIQRGTQMTTHNKGSSNAPAGMQLSPSQTKVIVA